MAIKNAKIEGTIVSFNTRNNLSATIDLKTYDAGHFTVCFDFTNPADVQRLQKLMNYVEVSQFDDLLGKIVRVGYVPGRCFIGFGHPLEDTFVPMNSDSFTELPECKFEELVKVHFD